MYREREMYYQQKRKGEGGVRVQRQADVREGRQHELPGFDIYVYTYIYIYIHTYKYVYMYIYIERERKR